MAFSDDTVRAAACSHNTVPLGHMGEPADIAEAIVFVACNQSRFATGSSLVNDGG